MRFMVLVRSSADSEAGALPSAELMAAMGRFNEELVQAGVLQAGEGLHPTSRGARVRFAGSGRSVQHGPFTPVDQQVAGFWLWNCASLDEAIAWVKRCPNPMPGDSEIEIRPLFEAEDFGAALSPDLRDQEERLRQQLASRP